MLSVSLPIFTGKPESFYISTSADSERLRSYQGPVTVDLNLPETVAFAVTLCFECLAAVGIKSCCKPSEGLQQLSWGVAWAPHDHQKRLLVDECQVEAKTAT